MDIITGKVSMPRRILMYGVEGSGKTTWASEAPNPVFLATEEGTNDLDVARFPQCTSTDDVVTYLGQLYDEDHSFKTVVIDTVDWLERIIHREVVEAHGGGIETVGEISYGRGYDKSVAPLQLVMSGLDALRRNRGMHCILIAHSECKRHEDPEREGYDRHQPKLHHKAANLLVEWCDEVFFAGFQTYTKLAGESFGKEIHKAVGEGERIVYTNRAKPTAIAKNRLGLPNHLPMSWAAFAEYL